MVYGDYDGPRLRKNKANQSQSQLAPRPALGVEKSKPISGKCESKKAKGRIQFSPHHWYRVERIENLECKIEKYRRKNAV